MLGIFYLHFIYRNSSKNTLDSNTIEVVKDHGDF